MKPRLSPSTTQPRQAYRCACAADRTGHAMLHTLYGMAMKFNIQFFGARARGVTGDLCHR